MSELISVIIPTKNRSLELKRALASVLNQTCQTFEILVIDDQSDENILEIVDSFQDKRIRYFLNSNIKTNANVCRNIGLKEARGFYIAMLDSDDEWLPKHLETKIKFLSDNEVDGVFGSAYIDFANGNRRLKLSRDLRPYESMIDYLLNGGNAQTSSYFFKSKAAKQVLWDEDLYRHQDFDYAGRFFERFTFLPCQDPTSIIHWAEGEKRFEDVNSQVLFLRKNKNRISPKNYVKYASETYDKLRNRIDVSYSEKQFFKNAALEKILFMSFADYSLIYLSTNKFQALNRRLFFCLRVLINK